MYRTMDARTRLESNLTAESEAYGYTLSIWGAGALLTHTFGLPDVERTLAYLIGALVGFTVLAVLAWGDISSEMSVEETPTSRVVSAIHLFATGGSILATHGLITVAGDLYAPIVFFLTGGLVTMAYNLLLLVEALVGRLLG